MLLSNIWRSRGEKHQREYYIEAIIRKGIDKEEERKNQYKENLSQEEEK